MGGEEASASTPSVNDPARASFSPHSKAEGDVAFASVYSEKTHLKKMIDNYYYKFIARIDGF